jgi:hypothetical protein
MATLNVMFATMRLARSVLLPAMAHCRLRDKPTYNDPTGKSFSYVGQTGGACSRDTFKSVLMDGAYGVLLKSVTSLVGGWFSWKIIHNCMERHRSTSHGDSRRRKTRSRSSNPCTISILEAESVTEAFSSSRSRSKWCC